MDIREEISMGIRRFKMDMLKKLPFYGDIMMRIRVIEDETIETACTDGREIRYNPVFFAQLSKGARNYVYMHEVLHILFLHWRRISERDPYIWNIACDYVVNGTLDNIVWKMDHEKIEFVRPAGLCVLPHKYEGEGAEELYNILVQRPQRKGMLRIVDLPGGGNGKKSDDKNNGDKNAEKNDDGKNEENDDLTRDELSEAEQLENEAKVKEMIREALQKAGPDSAWSIPKSFFRLVKSKILPWNVLLREYMNERVDDASYYTPERKYIHMGLILPGESKTEDLGEIWAFIDTSGSIGGQDMNEFVTQLHRISREFHCHMNLAFWDTSVHDVHKNIKNADMLLELGRRFYGGTNLNCVYDYLKAEKINPEVLIILTDGYFGTLRESPGGLKKKTIVVLTGKGSKEMKKDNEIGKLARL
ncbi:MAG: hypothetical protein IJM14_10895 [Lachnospiraceae bacterium]|nr:hypothetical protein [Lachnospiraceae bacterium]